MYSTVFQEPSAPFTTDFSRFQKKAERNNSSSSYAFRIALHSGYSKYTQYVLYVIKNVTAALEALIRARCEQTPYSSKVQPRQRRPNF